MSFTNLCEIQFDFLRVIIIILGTRKDNSVAVVAKIGDRGVVAHIKGFVVCVQVSLFLGLCFATPRAHNARSLSMLHGFVAAWVREIECSHLVFMVTTSMFVSFLGQVSADPQENQTHLAGAQGSETHLSRERMFILLLMTSSTV